MNINTEDMVAHKQITERLGINPNTLSNWQARYTDFPAPIFEAGAKFKVFDWNQVKAWFLAHPNLGKTQQVKLD